MATNLLSPAAKQRQLPSVGKSKLVQVSPFDEYLPKCPELGVTINLPLSAMAVVSETVNAITEFVLSSDISVTVIVRSCSPLVPPMLAPSMTISSPSA
jgi:hypothetical protein